MRGYIDHSGNPALTRRTRLSRRLKFERLVSFVSKLSIFPILILLLLRILLLSVFRPFLDDDPIPTLCWMLVGLISLIVFFNVRRRHVSNLITNRFLIDEPSQSIADAIECLGLNMNKQARATLQLRVLGLLKEMSAEDFRSLSGFQRYTLQQELRGDFERANPDEGVTYGLLSELARLGGREEYLFLQNLAATWRHAVANQNVLRHTGVCVGIIEGRLAENREKFRLLRPSQPDQDLLRPASSSGSEDIDQLLRPINEDDPK